MAQLIPTSPLQSRAAFFLSKTYARINSSTSKRVNTIATAIRQLIDSIGWSALKVRPMLEKELPYADDYTDMIDESRHDVQTIHNSFPQLAQQGLAIANYGEAQKLALTEIIATTASKVTELAAKANQELRGHFIGVGEQNATVRRKAELFVENFENSSHINMSSSKNIHFDPANTSVTLQRANDVDHSKAIVPFVDIFYGNALIGLPGNTVEVNTPNLNSIGNTYTPTVSFVGETTLNGDISAILDSNPDSVFEFERMQLVSENQPVVRIGDALIYSDSGNVQNIYSSIAPDDWTVVVSSTDEGKQKTQVYHKTGNPASNDGKGLMCDITLTFYEPKPINLIEIDPYIAQTIKGLPVVVESITVIPTIGKSIHLDTTRYTTHSNLNMHTDGSIIDRATYFLPKTTVTKEIRIILRQWEAYPTYAGHNFIVTTVETNKKKSMFGFTYSNKTTITKPRLKNQDEQYNYNKTKEFDISKATTAVGFLIGGPAGAAIGWLVGSLFGSKTTQTVLKTEKGVDVFKANRWQIGIRNIIAKQIKYEPTGSFISNPIVFENPVSNVALSASLKYSTDDGTLITFDVSPDGGTNWIPIDPETKVLTPFEKPTNAVVVRANLLQSNTIEDSGLTPILYGYSIEGYY